MNIKTGSITIYLCLTLTILLSLFAGMLKSVRTEGGRVMIASAMDQGLFSLFAQYDKDLLDEYDLFYLDGGFGSESLQMNRLYDTVRQDALYSLNPDGHGNRNFFGADFLSGAITGYTLATDQTGNSFVRQITEYMRQSLGVSGIQQLSNILTGQTDKIKSLEHQKNQISTEDPVDAYEQEKQIAGESFPETEEELRPHLSSGPEINPIEVISNLRRMGILGLVVTDPAQISQYKITPSALPSSRNLNQGMGVLPVAESNKSDMLLIIEYIMEKFPNYTSADKKDGLTYQAEYIIGEKITDAENLKAVINRLIAIREASNFIYLNTSPSKKSQADTMAATLASAMVLPIATPVISLALSACWAFAESILDIRELLDGGKIPLLKDDASWQLSLENLACLPDVLDSTRKSDSRGLDYNWYLRFLLFTKSQAHLVYTSMDLIEYNMNLKNPEIHFQIDNCVESLEVEGLWKLDSGNYSIRRSYGY